MIKYDKSMKKEIISAFFDNKILILLTDTVYGIMAIANKENERRINELKKSKIDKKLSVIFPDKEVLYKYLDNLDNDKKIVIEDKLPGKYTFIVNLVNFSDFDRSDFGIRITSNDYLQDILKVVGPVLATSCNMSGKDICNTSSEIEYLFKNEDVVLVLDEDANNYPSTIIDIRDDVKIIRD